MSKDIYQILLFIKAPLSFFISFLALLAISLGSKPFSSKSSLVIVMIFILSCSCASLNNIQDRKFDKQFQRTNSRLLVNNRKALPWAVFLCFFLFSAAYGILFFYFFNLQTIFLTILAIITYNICYTPLKKKTHLALIPGACAGILPLFIAWFAIEEKNLPPSLLLAASIIFLWQIPHSCLLILSYKDEKKCLSHHLVNHITPQLRPLFLLIWILSLVISLLFLSTHLLLQYESYRFLVYLAAFHLSFLFSLHCISPQKTKTKTLFFHLNMALFVFIFAVFLDYFFHF